MNWDLQIQKLANIHKGEWLVYWDGRDHDGTGAEQWASFIQSASGIPALAFQEAIQKAITDKRVVTVQERHGDNQYVYFVVGVK